MKIDLTNVELDQDDLNSLHDVISEALGKEDLTNEQITEYWKMFPEDMKLEALQWGMDTLIKDTMYLWLKENHS